MRKIGETVACYRSGKSGVEILSGLWSDDELSVDCKDPVGQLVGDKESERKVSQY